MKFSKNWETRKVAISPSHIDFLKEIAKQTGFNSLTDVVNHALGDYRLLKKTNTNTQANTNTSASNLSDTADNSSDDNDDFGLGDLI